MRILVTRAAEGADRLTARLLALGLEPVACPLVRVEPIAGPPIDGACYDWLVLTSRIAVREAARRIPRPWPPVAAVGPGTAAALAELGVAPAVVAREPSQEGLLAALPPTPGRVLFAGATGARNLLVEALGADRIDLYRTVERAPERLPACDLAALASPSAARSLARCDSGVPAVSIGRETTAAARAAGIEVLAEATRSDLDGFVAAIVHGVRALEARSRSGRVDDGEGRT